MGRVPLKPFYIHFREEKEASSWDEAIEYSKLFNSIIDSIAKDHPVYVRKLPTAYEHREFENNNIKYYASVRFTVGDTEIAGTKGRIDVKRIYDNNDLISGFGLINSA